VVAGRAEGHLHDGHAGVQGPELRNTSGQPTSTVTYRRSTAHGTFVRLALHRWHNLLGELTSQHEAFITRHLLSETYFLG